MHKSITKCLYSALLHSSLLLDENKAVYGSELLVRLCFNYFFLYTE